MSNVEYPDLIRILADSSGFEAKPGVQFAGQILPARSGDTTISKVIIQNAFDTEIEGEISIDVPQKKGLFKKSYLSTVSPVPFRLESAEVKIVEIPIRTQFETPEGEYEVALSISGKQLAKGERIRGGKKKVGTDWGKSGATSAVISAILLPVLGGVAVYQVSNTLKGKLRVIGRADIVDQSPLETKEQTVFGEQEIKYYKTAYEWFTNSSKILKQPKANVLFAGTIRPWIEELLQEKGVKPSKVELELISRFIAIQSLSIIPGLATTLALNVEEAIKQGICKIEDLQPNISSLNEIALKLWADNLSKDRKLMLLAMSAGLAWHSVYSRIFKKKVNILEQAKGIAKNWKEEGSKEWVIQNVLWPIIFDGVRAAPSIFPDKEERMEFYNSLLKAFKSYHPNEKEYSQELLKMTVGLIEKVIDEEKID